MNTVWREKKETRALKLFSRSSEHSVATFWMLGSLIKIWYRNYEKYVQEQWVRYFLK